MAAKVCPTESAGLWSIGVGGLVWVPLVMVCPFMFMECVGYYCMYTTVDIYVLDIDREVM